MMPWRIGWGMGERGIIKSPGALPAGSPPGDGNPAAGEG